MSKDNNKKNVMDILLELVNKHFGDSMFGDLAGLCEDCEAVEIAVNSGNTSLIMGSLKHLSSLCSLRGDKDAFLKEAFKVLK